MFLTCFLFGHSTAPESLQPMIERAVEDYYELGFRIFVVGYHGDFDRMAIGALRKLGKRHEDVTLLLLTPYHPSERDVPLPEGFDFPYYPDGMENVPKKLCIVRANEYMSTHCDGIICYARHPGNARNLFEKVSKKVLLTRNIAWEEKRREDPEYVPPEMPEIFKKYRIDS